MLVPILNFVICVMLSMCFNDRQKSLQVIFLTKFYHLKVVPSILSEGLIHGSGRLAHRCMVKRWGYDSSSFTSGRAPNWAGRSINAVL